MELPDEVNPVKIRYKRSSHNSAG